MPRGAKPRVVLDMPLILTRIKQGEFVAHIAAEFGLTKQALSQRVRSNPKGIAAIKLGMAERQYIARRSWAKSVTKSLKALERGRETDLLDLTRARQQMRMRITLNTSGAQATQGH